MLETRLNNVTFYDTCDYGLVNVFESFFDRDTVSCGALLRKSTLLMANLAHITKSKWTLITISDTGRNTLKSILYTVADTVVHRIDIQHEYYSRNQCNHSRDLIDESFKCDKFFKQPIVMGEVDFILKSGKYRCTRIYRDRIHVPDSDGLSVTNTKPIWSCTVEPRALSLSQRLLILRNWFKSPNEYLQIKLISCATQQDDSSNVLELSNEATVSCE